MLAHSRWFYVEFTLGQSQDWWIACHQCVLSTLGCVPREELIDNCKTAVLAYSPGTALVFNAQYLASPAITGSRSRPASMRFRNPMAASRTRSAT